MTMGLSSIDGPPPLKPRYGLIQATEVPGSGVRLVPDADGLGVERWGHGASVYPYPPGIGEVHASCTSGTSVTTKGRGDDQPEAPDFGPLTVTKAYSCTARGTGQHDDFKARIVAAFEATEGATVEKEFLTGARVPSNPHLADGEGTFPNGDTPTSILNGLALLEQEIARSGRMGVIHVTPQAATFLHNNGAISDVNGALRTVNGITVIPGFGYVDGSTPLDGHDEPTGWEEWIYATGPVDIRRSGLETIPDTEAEALDRGLGASLGEPNTVIYIAERFYLVVWDTVVQAAVLVNRCSDACGSAPS